MITLISSKKLGGYKIMRNTVGQADQTHEFHPYLSRYVCVICVGSDATNKKWAKIN